MNNIQNVNILIELVDYIIYDKLYIYFYIVFYTLKFVHCPVVVYLVDFYSFNKKKII